MFERYTEATRRAIFAGTPWREKMNRPAKVAGHGNASAAEKCSCLPNDVDRSRGPSGVAISRW